MIQIHNTHILLRSEIRAACAQSFAPWQQATIEIMCHNLSYYCLLTLHIQWYYSSHTSRSWWITQTTPPKRLQQYYRFSPFYACKFYFCRSRTSENWLQYNNQFFNNSLCTK